MDEPKEKETTEKSEYQVKYKIRTRRLLPPYQVEGMEVREAKSANEAIEHTFRSGW